MLNENTKKTIIKFVDDIMYNEFQTMHFIHIPCSASL